MLSHIAIIITNRCDLKCAHCLRGYSKERPDFPLDLLDKLLTEALPFGAKQVALTGGEPHLHPHFAQMVEKIVAYGYRWHFVSHGQHSEPYLPLMEKFRCAFSHAALSLDGASAETHDAIRNRRGAFDRVQATAKQYIASGYKVRISTTLNRMNKSELEGIVRMAQEWGASGINIAGTIPVEWGQELVLNDSESRELYEQAVALRGETNFDIRTLSSLYTDGGVHFCRNLDFREVAVNARGEMIFCCDTTENGAATGSLRDHSLIELVKLWLGQSQELQTKRAEYIATGKLGEKFDTCAFCNDYFDFL